MRTFGARRARHAAGRQCSAVACGGDLCGWPRPRRCSPGAAEEVALQLARSPGGPVPWPYSRQGKPRRRPAAAGGGYRAACNRGAGPAGLRAADPADILGDPGCLPGGKLPLRSWRCPLGVCLLQAGLRAGQVTVWLRASRAEVAGWRCAGGGAVEAEKNGPAGDVYAPCGLPLARPAGRGGGCQPRGRAGRGCAGAWAPARRGRTLQAQRAREAREQQCHRQRERPGGGLTPWRSATSFGTGRPAPAERQRAGG
mmetsp:Transcript_35876/g.111463  ORF Transcript_35876/g.111463 Transcript_35876/m.111463 type:complete len:255 (+) Transcript_35876:505-1269(+)